MCGTVGWWTSLVTVVFNFLLLLQEVLPPAACDEFADICRRFYFMKVGLAVGLILPIGGSPQVL